MVIKYGYFHSIIIYFLKHRQIKITIFDDYCSSEEYEGPFPVLSVNVVFI